MLRQLGIFFCLSLVIFSTQAEDEIRYYDVEFILFEHLDARNRQSENWQTRRRAVETDQEEPVHELGKPYVMDAKSPYDREAMFTPIPDSQKKLNEEAKLIEKSPTRRILAHIAWRQPGLPKDQAVWVHFKQLLNNNKDSSQQASHTSPDDFLAGERRFTPYVEGKLKVMLARYLHVDTDILYFANPLPGTVSETNQSNETLSSEMYSDAQTVNQEPNVFLMNQLRHRIRSTELHYLDHPVMGMLLLITPFEKPEKAN